MSIAASSVGGCWAEDELVHGAFTNDQWEHLRADFSFKPGDEPACDATCMTRAPFGQQLFFEPRLSGPWLEDPMTGVKYPAAKISCSTCHDPAPAKTAGWYADTRADNAVSMGATGPTPHNTISIVNVAFSRTLYGWTGQCTDPVTMQPGDCTKPNDIVHDIALPKAMKSDAQILYQAISSTPSYLASYQALFGALNLATVQANTELALDAYLRRLASVDSPFDKFIGGNDLALDASATRGFAVFVGRGMCVECHSGPLFTDGLAHVTGVIDAKLDKGRGGTGAFLTPPLRQVAETGPYMHNGSLEMLADVIWFYRQGGDASGYVGTKDPLMSPLDITDDEAKDLEAFLRSLTGDSIDSALRQDTHAGSSSTPMTCTVATNNNTGLLCNGACMDVMNDPANCGSCGNPCMSGTCMAGMCVAPPPPPMCPMPMTLCGTTCFDLSLDPMNCGSCGNACPANKPICTMGSCHA